MRFGFFNDPKPHLFFMKRLLLLATAALASFMGASNSHLAPPVSSDPSQQVSVDSDSLGWASTSEGKQVAEVYFRNRSKVTASYDGAHYKDISGPRRVKYGKSRWITLS